MQIVRYNRGGRGHGDSRDPGIADEDFPQQLLIDSTSPPLPLPPHLPSSSSTVTGSSVSVPSSWLPVHRLVRQNLSARAHQNPPGSFDSPNHFFRPKQLLPGAHLLGQLVLALPQLFLRRIALHGLQMLPPLPTVSPHSPKPTAPPPLERTIHTNVSYNLSQV